MKKIISLCLIFIIFSANAYAVNTATNSLGEKTYQHACVKCHAPNVAGALKAPAAFNKQAWQTRIQHAKLAIVDNEKYKDEYQYLVHQVKIGKGLMHHHGLCLESPDSEKVCNDAAYVEAIKYMAKVEE